HQAMQRSGAPFLFLRGEFAAARLRSVRAGGRVLVAVNGSESPAELAELVKTIAPGSRALVFHVREMVVAEAMTYVEPADDGAAIVEAVDRALMSRGVQAESIAALETESVPKSIVRQAKDYRADLIVVGSRRLSSAAGLLLGSVAHEVIHLADRPVLVAGRLNARVTAARRAAMAPA
ncbi:MAG: universal stress protein, partial [Chloroflexi bacterium]